MISHDQTAHAQFDPQARAYLASAVHARGPDLQRAAQQVAALVPAGGGCGLDVGCGAGHLSFALAPVLARIVAADPSAAMLACVQEVAREHGWAHLETVQAGAESLPFADGSFCVVATRYSAHHWTRLDQALPELMRVLKPGGALLVIDVLGDEDALVDTHLQAMELLRDRSHVRNRSASQWQALLQGAGLVDVVHEHWPLRLEFTSWVERMRTPPGRVAMLRTLQQEAPREVQQALGIEPDGSFTARTGWFWARKRGG